VRERREGGEKAEVVPNAGEVVQTFPQGGKEKSPRGKTSVHHFCKTFSVVKRREKGKKLLEGEEGTGDIDPTGGGHSVKGAHEPGRNDRAAHLLKIREFQRKEIQKGERMHLILGGVNAAPSLRAGEGRVSVRKGRLSSLLFAQ